MSGDFGAKLLCACVRDAARGAQVFLTREKATRRETRIVPLLTFISTVIWKALFGHPAEVPPRTEGNAGLLSTEFF